MIPSFKGLTGALDKLKHDLELQAAPLQAEIESIGHEAADAIVKANPRSRRCGQGSRTSRPSSPAWRRAATAALL
jgi:hypothetical protein